MAPLHILCKGYLGSVLNTTTSGGTKNVNVPLASPGSLSTGTTKSSSNGTERMEVDSDSEVEILTTTSSPSEANGTPSPKAAATNGSATKQQQEDNQLRNSQMESKLKRIARVELQLSV